MPSAFWPRSWPSGIGQCVCCDHLVWVAEHVRVNNRGAGHRYFGQALLIAPDAHTISRYLQRPTINDSKKFSSHQAKANTLTR